NHFAHYVAIVFPLAVFLAAVAWREAGPREMRVRQRIINLLERRFLLVTFAVVTAIACVAAILVAQSRGGLLSLAAGSLIVGSFVTGRRPLKLALMVAAGAILVAALVLLIGTERTIARFKPLPEEQTTLVGRRTGIEAAVGVWRRFPLLGSGAGTFPSVVLLEQKADVAKHYHRAHDDYAELAATQGGIGFAVGVATLVGGWLALWRITFGAKAAELRWRRRAFQAAALASLTIAVVHALIDFNFFIPSNPATLAAIAGAAVAVYDSDDRRTRR
ncbi:MAG TPA: O-antigen ligase family protein, partial [Thermoanaerobaculia bacterium]